MLGELAHEAARTQQRSMFALIPLASATDAIDAWGSRANATTRALNSSECLRQLRLCGLPVVGEVGVVYMCPSKVCGHKHPRSATPVQGEIAGRIPINGERFVFIVTYSVGEVFRLKLKRPRLKFQIACSVSMVKHQIPVHPLCHGC